MSKSFTKNVSGGLNSLLSSGNQQPVKPKAKVGRKKTNTRVISKTSQEGTKEGETRATFIVSEQSLEKIKNISYWQRLSIKDVVNDALSEYLERHEKKNGPVKPRQV